MGTGTGRQAGQSRELAGPGTQAGRSGGQAARPDVIVLIGLLLWHHGENDEMCCLLLLLLDTTNYAVGHQTRELSAYIYQWPVLELNYSISIQIR